MTEVEQLEQAIAALESQRSVLGDAVVDTALAPLREKLETHRQRSFGEQRKIVTVLFADLVGFTSLSEALDPEELREILDDYFSRWTGFIEEHSGRVEKYIGDAVMAVFGIPVSYEMDAENAVLSALAMRASLEKLNNSLQEKSGVSLAMRVGIHTGPVVASTLGERGKHSAGQDFVVVGDTVNIASRLQSIAPDGEILISHETYRYVRGAFDVQTLEPSQLKGKSTPVQTYQVLRARPRAFRPMFPGVEGIETHMIGRGGELSRLQDAFWEVLQDHECQVITLVGEAGIGKSRLMYEFDNWLEDIEVELFYFRGRATPPTQRQPYALLRDIFSFRFQIQDNDAPEVVMRKLERGVALTLGDNEAATMKAHFIGYLLGFEIGESEPLASATQDVKGLHDRAIAYLGDYFRSLASESPVVILLEDIHWADDSSLDLVNRLSGPLAQQPMLVVETARPTLFERRADWGVELPFHSQIHLQPLSRRDSRKLVEEILRNLDTVPDELRELLVTNSEGNPFYIEELVKMLIEEGVIITGEGAWQVVSDRLADIRVPPTLTGVLQARIDRLKHEERHMLQCAAVVGRVFWDEAVAYIHRQVDLPEEGTKRPNQAGPGAAGLPTGKVLADLRDREMVYKRPESSFDGTGEYFFKHALLRDVAYENVLRRQRRIYHGHAAFWLEQVTQNSRRAGEYAAAIADHFEQAGILDRASFWYWRAGEQAAIRFANTEAVHHFRLAYKHSNPEDLDTRFKILLACEKVYDRQGNRQAQIQDLDELEKLADRLDSDQYRAMIFLRRANLGFVTGDYHASEAYAKKGLERAQASRFLEGEISSLLAWGKALAWQSRHAEANEHLLQARSLSQANSMPAQEAESYWNLAIVATNQSLYDQALEYLHQSIELYRKVGDQSGESLALGQTGVVYLSLANFPKAKEYLEKSLKLFQHMGIRLREGIILNNLGVIAYVQGDYEEATRLHTHTLQLYREINDKYGIASSITNLGDIYREVGKLSMAMANYDQALAVAREINDKSLEAIILANQSQIHIQSHDFTAAIETSEQASALTQETETPLYQAYSLIRLGEALLADGQLEAAKNSFYHALELHRSLGLENNVMESNAALARIAVAYGDLDTARHLVHEILEHLETKDLDGTDQPVQIIFTCYRVLRLSGDSRAGEMLQKTYDYLQNRAAKIQDADSRRSFLENIPIHKEVVGIFEKERG